MTAVDAVLLGGLAGPLLLVAALVVVPAAVARVLTRLATTAVVLTLPIAVSVLLVNVFFFPGGREVLLQLGPVRATAEGVALALEVLARLAAIGGAVTLFYLTTTTAALVADLERRGVPRMLTFVTASSVQTVPATVERAREIAAAQRARGLDTEGGPLRRARGLVPLVGPVLLGALAEVEERTLALEARGFSTPGRRTLLWAPADSTAERVARWLMVATVPMLVALRLAGPLG